MARRLLIVDDDLPVAELIERVAQRQGFDTLVARDPARFAEVWQAFDPDIILLDIVMPELDGIALLHQLAAAECRARVILISGSDPYLLECGQRLGQAYGLQSVQCLHKPIGLSELRSSLAAGGEGTPD
jgi:DNA-binding response OmpR family regulator